MSVFISLGGPDYVISVKGKHYPFEMHPYCGPCPLDADGEPLDDPMEFPDEFWQAVTHWAQQGQQVDVDQCCLYEWPAEPIMKHLGGRHWKIIGYTEPTKGE